jgi:hypothetical protein
MSKVGCEPGEAGKNTMKFRDLLSDWSEPVSVVSWADEISPRPNLPWFAYLNNHVHPDIVTVIGRLLIPAFVEYEGGVFLRDRFSLDGYSRWKAELGETVAVEKIINHQHVYDLFATDEEILDASFQSVANLMAQTLRLALTGSFPERRFIVYTSNSDQDYGPVVGFHSAEP